jgi:hypothetical protein
MVREGCRRNSGNAPGNCCTEWSKCRRRQALTVLSEMRNHLNRVEPRACVSAIGMRALFAFFLGGVR